MTRLPGNENGRSTPTRPIIIRQPAPNTATALRLERETKKRAARTAKLRAKLRRGPPQETPV